MSTYTPKAWLDYPNLTTPTDADAWKAMEQRTVSYAASEAISVGEYSYEHFRPKQNPAGADMRVALGSPSVEMMTWIRDASGGVYRYQYNGAQLLATIGTSDPANPRIDRICLTAPASSDSIVPQVVVLAGTATAGATTANLTGAQAIPAGYELVADVVVGAGVTTIVTANIVDRRRIGGIMGSSGVAPFAVLNAGPTSRDEVVLTPSDALPLLSVTLVPATHDNFGGAYLVNLSRGISGATRIRWRYAQGATPATSNYNVAILDPSGRLIIAVGATAFTGAANAIVEVANTITATTFEPGDYIVWMGVAALTGASAVSFYGVQGNGTVTAPGAGQRNQKFTLNSGGTTFPASNTLSGYTDVVAAVAAYTALPMPIFSLSVG